MHSCLLVDPKTSCLLMDPENHQGSIKRHEVLGPSKDMRFWPSSGSIKRHEVLNFDLGPSKHMRFFQLSSIVAHFKK